MRPMTDAHRPGPLQRVFYWLVWYTTLALFTAIYRIRRYHTGRIPRTGPVLIAANHQSHLDPPLVSMCCPHRPTHFLARAGLFKNRAFGWLITALNSVPIKEESGDIAAIRQILARLDTGVPVILFPEGSRSPDGAQHEFKRGIALLLKRSKCPVVPVAVEGCFDAYPRHRALPRLWGQRVAVMVGQPIEPDDLLKDGPEAALRRLEREIDAMRLDLRAKLRAATHGRYPAPGPGDEPYDRERDPLVERDAPQPVAPPAAQRESTITPSRAAAPAS